MTNIHWTETNRYICQKTLLKEPETKHSPTHTPVKNQSQATMAALLGHRSDIDSKDAMFSSLLCLTYRVCIQQVENKRPFPFLIPPSANHTRHTSARINGCYRNHHFWNRQTQCLWRTQPSQSSVKSVGLGFRKCLENSQYLATKVAKDGVVTLHISENLSW